MTAANPFSPAFDAHAARYDAAWSEHPLVQALRARVIARCAQVFPRGGRVLDLGCGTGVDAAALAALGFRVEAVDASPAMVALARARGVAARRADLEDVEGTWDGVLSDFGALNCLPTLSSLGARLAAALRVGRCAVLVVMSRRCLSERLALAMRLRGARRRDGSVQVDGAEVAVRYLDAGIVADELGSAFRLVRVEALGALVAPPDLGGQRCRRSTLEPWLARLPGVRSQGDHTMLVFRRT